MTPRPATGKRKNKTIRSNGASTDHPLIFFLIAASLVYFIGSEFSGKSPLTAAAVAQEKAEATPLIPGNSVSQEIAPGTSQAYLVNLRKGQYLALSLQKKDLHILVTIQNPSGEKSGTFISRRYGPLEVFHIAKSSGSYLVSVQSLEKEAERGPYSMTLREPRDSSPIDQTYEAAIKASSDAELSRAEWREQSLHKAISKYLEASQEWQSINHHKEAAQALVNIGDVYSMLSKYDLARDSYEKALEITQSAGDRGGEIEALNDIGYAHSYLGDNKKALKLLTQSLDSSEAAPSEPQNNRRMAQALNNIGEVYYAFSDLPKAFDYFNRALVLWADAGDRSGQALAHINLGYNFYESGDIQKASTHYQLSLSLRQAIDDRRGEALARTAIGGVYSFLGEKQLALDWHNEAMKRFRDMGDRLGEAAALNGIGRAYEDLGENQIALDSYSQARDLYQRAGKRDYEALSYFYIGRVYRTLGDASAALKFHNQCISLSRRARNYRFEAYARKDIGIIYNSLGLREKALDRFGQVLKFYREIEDKRGEAYALSSIGYTWYLSGNFSKAIQYYQEALPLSRSIMDRSAEVSFLHHMALAEREKGEPDKALAHIRESTEIIESMRTKVVSGDLRASYFASVHQHYELYIDLLMQLDKHQPDRGYLSQAFEISEQARARSLLDSLTEVKLDLPNDSDPTLLRRLGQLRQSLNAKAEYQMRVLNSKHSPEMAAQTDKEIRELRAEYDQAEAQLRAQSKQYAALSGRHELRLADIQAQMLGTNSLLLEFALGDKRSYLWVVSSSSIKGYELPNRKTLEQAATRTYELLIARQPVPGESASEYQKRVELSDGHYWEEASLLSQFLLGPVKDQLPGKRLMVVADGALHYVPFDALPTPGVRNDENSQGVGAPATLNMMPLALNHEIVNLPSASVLAAVRRDDALPASRTIAVLADPVFARDDPRVERTLPAPARAEDSKSGDQKLAQAIDNSRNLELYVNRLPSTLREAQMIIKLVSPSEGVMLTGFDANHEAAVSANLSHYRVIHFATHGVTDPVEPGLSGIILSLVDRHGNTQDGFLRLHEIYGLRLAADLVVLSACQTGLGKNVKGEGLVGLTRGFIYAGSKSVIATLWKVDDEATTELMTHFYQALLNEHLPPGTALQNAKIALWKQKRWQSPYFWAAFQLHGEHTKPINSGTGRQSKIYLMGLALMAICLAAGYYVYRLFQPVRVN